jgi:hypothetical protein
MTGLQNYMITVAVPEGKYRADFLDRAFRLLCQLSTTFSQRVTVMSFFNANVIVRKDGTDRSL